MRPIVFVFFLWHVVATALRSQEEEYEPFGTIRSHRLIGLFPFDGPATNIAPMFDTSRYDLLLI